MVAVREFRIVLPFTVEEYRLAQLYMVAKYSAAETSGEDGDGVEILKNEPFEDQEKGVKGQYTHKVYHLANKLPSWLSSIVPKKALTLEEEAWNAYPRCTTVLRCPFFKNFVLQLETMHLQDRGHTENALGLDKSGLKKRQVEFIDIAMDPVDVYNEAEDPLLFKSEKTGRGPLKEGWQSECEPVMTAYKVVTVDVPYWGFGTKLERFISRNAQRKVLLEGHRKCFCWIDEWFGLTMDDIRKMEDETAEHISRIRAKGKLQADLKTADSGDADGSESVEDGSPSREASFSAKDETSVQPVSRRNSMSGTPRSPNAAATATPRSASSSQSSRRGSLVGPEVIVGISTLSASDANGSSSAPHSPAPPIPFNGSPGSLPPSASSSSGNHLSRFFGSFSLSPILSPATSPAPKLSSSALSRNFPSPEKRGEAGSANGRNDDADEDDDEDEVFEEAMEELPLDNEADTERCLQILEQAIALTALTVKAKGKGVPPTVAAAAAAARSTLHCATPSPIRIPGTLPDAPGYPNASSLPVQSSVPGEGTTSEKWAARGVGVEHCVAVLEKAKALLQRSP